MHSIRFKITAITVIAILTAIIAVFAACYRTVRIENDSKSAAIMELIGQNTKKSLESFFDSIEQSVEMAGNLASDTLDSVMLVEYGAAGTNARQTERTEEQISQMDEYLHSYSSRIQETFESVASRTSGVVTYYYCINPEISQTEHGFFYSKVGKTGFSEQEPLDARTLDPEDIEHTTWYYTPIRRGRPSWVGPYTAHFLGEMWISSYLIPIYKAGALIGVLGMDIPVETLVEQVKDIHVYKSGFAILFDSEGRVLYHPHMDIGEAADQLIATVRSAMMDQNDDEDQMVRCVIKGEERQMFLSTLSNGLKLVITAPVHEINASWTYLSHVVLVIAAVVIAIFSVLLMNVIRIITQPLTELTAASKRLAAADYDVELNHHGHDEVGALTGAFSQMQSQLKLQIEDLNRRANYDDLTGLPNMRSFFHLAEAERARLLENGKKPMMLYFDMIGMKHYNRQFGFEEGDKLLREVAKILSVHFGEKCICRYSEDHFAAVTDEASMEEKLRMVFSECENVNGGNSLPVRVGIYANDMEDVNVSVACDRAKYACDKHRGSYNSAYYFFDRDMLEQLEDVRYIINHFDQALSERWIKVYYQPIIRTLSGKVSDEEALSRWVDPDRGLLSPAEFIPILEKARMIYKLDLYVLDQILEKMINQRQAGLSIVPHSLNLSRADFDSCDIVEEIRKRVDAAGIGRDKLTIEVTESMIGSDFDFMKEQILRFKSLGFQVWMDDFGSGYSSLDVLQSIPFDLLKFDMHFMKLFDKEEKTKIILRELVHMAIGLGIDTLCEGVETSDQVEFLREIGCAKLQGFFFCKPIPFEEILDRYDKGKQIGFEDTQTV